MKKCLGCLYSILLAISFCVGNVYAEDNGQVTLVSGGDVEWSENSLWPPSILFLGGGISPFSGSPEKAREGYGKYATPLYVFPYRVTKKSKAYAKQKYGKDIDGKTSHHIAAERFKVTFDSIQSKNHYPFIKISPLLKKADIALVNLEMPLSDTGRMRGKFRGPTSFAEALARAGIDVATTANNHIMDADEQGLFDTIRSLQENGISSIGTGKNLNEARKPYIYDNKGIKIAFLGYTQQTNGWAGDFALPDRSGVMPLDPFLVKEDVHNARNAGADFVVLTIHWGMENTQKVHPEIVQMGHQLIDAGADVILGHASHVPQAVEVYKNKIIFYSMGNLIFGHNHDFWMDNILAQVNFSKTGIESAKIIPIAGTGKKLSQPYPLTGKAANDVLQNIHQLSEKFDTRIVIDNGVGDVVLH